MKFRVEQYFSRYLERPGSIAYRVYVMKNGSDEYINIGSDFYSFDIAMDYMRKYKDAYSCTDIEI